MNFGEVLSRAWQIIWRHKVLWLFGILASCGGNTNGSFSSNYSVSDRRELPPQLQPFFERFENITDTQIALLVGIGILVILILVILAIFLGTIGRIGIIRGTQQVEQGADRLGFGDLFRDSLPFFWRVFGLNLLFGIAAFLVVLILIIPFTLLAVVTFGLAALCIIPLVCIIVPLMWLAQVLVTQASIAMVVENAGIREGVRRGWDLFRTNLGTIVVMALILMLGVGLIGGIIIALPLAAVVVPAVIGAAAGTDQAMTGGLLTAGLCFLAYLPVLLVLSGILTAYIESAWTLTYMRLTNKPVAPPLEPITA
jgi:hypothetical protein